MLADKGRLAVVQTYSWPILGSMIPRRNFCFLELLVAGRWVVKKLFSVFVTLL